MALVDLLNQDLEDPSITQKRRIEANVVAMQRMGTRLDIVRSMNQVTDLMATEVTEYLGANIDMIRYERDLISDKLIERAAARKAEAEAAAATE